MKKKQRLLFVKTSNSALLQWHAFISLLKKFGVKVAATVRVNRTFHPELFIRRPPHWASYQTLSWWCNRRKNISTWMRHPRWWMFQPHPRPYFSSCGCQLDDRKLPVETKSGGCRGVHWGDALSENLKKKSSCLTSRNRRPRLLKQLQGF